MTDYEIDKLEPTRDVYSISRLNREARTLLEGSFPLLWVEGEISNFARPASGHWYFTLKDEAAQVRCAMFRNRNMHVQVKPENGMQVLIRARISMYEARGEFQIIAEHMEEAGDGALRRAFEALKDKLNKEGLFDAKHKKPLPAFPGQIGVITSPTGAAIRDILTTLKRRYPAIPVIVYPVPVQGADSAEQIASMLKTVNERNECDVLLLARGGGSLEDLQSFNEESVARAIHASNIPVICGVGHEIDFTIADFVADQRAATPTAAAELVSPNRYELQTKLSRQLQQLSSLMTRILEHSWQKLAWLEKRLQHPGRLLQEKSQRLDDLQRRQLNAVSHALRHTQVRLSHLADKIQQRNPAQLIRYQQERLVAVSKILNRNITLLLQGHKEKLQQLGHNLHTVSPLATLDRGYAIVKRDKDKKLVRSYKQLKVGEKVTARLAEGHITCKVENANPEES
jgi:exodeoxyribonuclease VII large subunit